jgi:hypothetical protein
MIYITRGEHDNHYATDAVGILLLMNGEFFFYLKCDIISFVELCFESSSVDDFNVKGKVRS